jgi:hypothetical protein
VYIPCLLLQKILGLSYAAAAAGGSKFLLLIQNECCCRRSWGCHMLRLPTTSGASAAC